jgi:hypothetical protein
MSILLHIARHWRGVAEVQRYFRNMKPSQTRSLGAFLQLRIGTGLLLLSYLLLQAGCFFRVPTGTHSWHDVMAVRVSGKSTNVVQKLIRKSTYVDEFAAMDPEGGGNYSRFWKESYYIENVDDGRIKLKGLESLTFTPSTAGDWLLPPGLVTSNTFARMLLPGTGGGLMYRPTDGQGHYLTNAWALGINFSSYHRSDGPPYLKVYLLDRHYKVVRARTLPLSPPEAPGSVCPDIRLDRSRQRLTFNTPEGYMTYDALADTVTPASQPLPEPFLPLNFNAPLTPFQ